MALNCRPSRNSSALGIARKSALTAYLAPQKQNLTQFVELSGSGLVVPYNQAQAANTLITKPPEWDCNGGFSTATTPVLAATRPPNFTVHLWAKVTNTPSLYAFGTVSGSDTFIRTAVGDLRAYIIASDGGWFLISSDQTPPLGKWLMFTITAAPNDFRLYLNDKQVAQVAGHTARADANFQFKYNWHGGNHILGASMLYVGATLSQKEVAQNYAFTRAAHGYP